MAFTEEWLEDEPDGAVITISQLDNYIRQTKVAVRERLEGDPADPLTGIFETDSFAEAPVVKAGISRLYFGLEADIGDADLQNGRGYFTTDEGDGHPKLYHLHEDGAIELGYLNRDGSRAMTGRLLVNHTVEAVTSVQTGIQVQNIQTAGAYTVTDSYGIRIYGSSEGAGVTVTNQYALKIEAQTQGGTLNYAIYTDSGLIRFGDHVLIEGAKTLRTNGAIHLNLESAGTVARLYGTVDGDVTVQYESDFTLLHESGSTFFRADPDGNVLAGKSNLGAAATDGFFYIPEIDDDPVGVPTEIDGYVPCCIDMTAGRFWFYDHASTNWLSQQFT
jgi:hypothetical protein